MSEPDPIQEVEDSFGKGWERGVEVDGALDWMTAVSGAGGLYAFAKLHYLNLSFPKSTEGTMLRAAMKHSALARHYLKVAQQINEQRVASGLRS